MQVGLAEPGRMGVRLTANLAATGLDVNEWNRTHETAQTLASSTGALQSSRPFQ
ncbi:hypothetical protein LAB1_26430 [Roseibium sp. LAB1]